MHHRKWTYIHTYQDTYTTIIKGPPKTPTKRGGSIGESERDNRRLFLEAKRNLEEGFKGGNTRWGSFLVRGQILWSNEACRDAPYRALPRLDAHSY